MADIYISCVEADSSFVWQLASQLESRGWSVWWDKDFRADADVAAETERELVSARRVLVLWTRASVSSPFVLHDAHTAFDANKLVQVKASDVRVSDIPRSLQSLPLLDAVDLVAIARELSNRREKSADLPAETVHSEQGQPSPTPEEPSQSIAKVSSPSNPTLPLLGVKNVDRFPTAPKTMPLPDNDNPSRTQRQSG
jgi:TIR domain-containing protein